MVKLPANSQKIILGILVFCLIWILFAFAIHTALLDNTLGADFATFWIGSRTVLLQGQTPYSADVTAASQQLIYHRAALPEEDQLAFAYPLPSVFLLLPVAWMSLDWAQAFWMALNILALLTALFLLFPNTPGYIRFTYFLFYPVIFGLILGNFAILISVFILLFLQLIFTNKKHPDTSLQVISAIFLAFCIIKPQFAWGYLLLALLVSLRDRLWPFLSVLFAASLFLLISSLLIIPSWPLAWLKRVNEYALYVKGQPALMIQLQHILPDSWVPISALIFTVLVAVMSVWLIYKWWRHDISSLFLVIWVGFTTYLFHPHGISYEQITFILPFLLWAAAEHKTKGTILAWFFAIILSWVLFFLTFFNIIPIAVNEFPFLFYIVWMFALLGPKFNKSLIKTKLKI